MLEPDSFPPGATRRLSRLTIRGLLLRDCATSASGGAEGYG